MSHLFTPFKIRSLELKNRIVTSPMCQYSSEDGFANDWHLVHLGARAVGGSSLVMSEATAVSPEGRISPYDLGIWKDAHIDGLRRITTFVKQQGAIPGIQLAHAGRKGSHLQPWNGGGQLTAAQGGWQSIAPSDVPFSPHETAPLALSTGEIERLVADFKAAAKRALEAGFKVIEIHAAHGYLIHEFLSPLSNRRTDEWGGTFENRVRFLLQLVQTIRKEWPQDYPLFVRISATDWVDGGWTVEDSIQLAGILKTAGIDLIDCSSGGNVHQAPIPAAPSYQVPFAEAIRRGAGIPTGAVGIIVTAEQAEGIIASGKADLVFLARELLRDPYFPLRAAGQLGHDASWPVQYERAKRPVR